VPEVGHDSAIAVKLYGSTGRPAGGDAHHDKSTTDSHLASTYTILASSNSKIKCQNSFAGGQMKDPFRQKANFCLKKPHFAVAMVLLFDLF
jgi:hypothetical protein